MSTQTTGKFDTVDEAIQEIAAGRLIIVTDDEDRENEGDLIMAASKATPETVNMMVRYGSGIVCVPTTEYQLRRLGLGPMVMNNRESHRTDFAVSVDAAEGVTTGISAYDRTEAIRILADPDSSPDRLVQPGHVFPLRARAGGVLERAGHTEAAVDLAILAGLHPSGVLCEIVNDDGTMARLPELIEFREKFGLKMISIAQLIEYRHQREQLVERVGQRPFVSEFGEFVLHVFRSRLDSRHHFALTMGELTSQRTLVRVHSANALNDVFLEKGQNSQQSLVKALEKVREAGSGVILYMEPTMAAQAEHWENQPGDCSSGPMSFRDYGIGAQILVALGLRQICLLSSTTRRVVGLDGYGIEIVEQIAL